MAKELRAKLVIEAATDGLESIRQMIGDLKKAGIETNDFERAADALGNELDAVHRKLAQTGKQAGALGDESSDLAKDMLAAAENGERLANELRKTALAAGQNARSAEKAGRAWGVFKSGVLSGLVFTGALLGITGLTAGIGALRDGLTEVVSVGARFEVLQKQLESLYGSAAQAEKAMGWIKEFSKTTPFELDAVTDSFVKLKAMGLDPMDGSFAAIAEQASALGGSSETLSGIVLALGQAWTKQKLQGEEALQLIERGVPVWDLLAKATGKTAVELQEMSAAGKLGRDAIRDLMDEMGRVNAGASANALNTWNGQVSILKSNWLEFLDLIARSGVLDLFREELLTINKAIAELAQTGELKEWAQQVSDAITKLYGGLKAVGEVTLTAAGFVNTFSAELGALTKVAIGIKALGLGKTFLGWGADAMLGATRAQAAASLFSKAGQVAAAGWLGWNVGTYLRDEFLVIEQAGIALAAGLTKSAARAQTAWQVIKAPFNDDTIEAAQERLRLKLQEIDDEYASLFVSASQAREEQKRGAAASDAAAVAAVGQAQAQEKVTTGIDKTKRAQQELLTLLGSGAKGAQEAIDRLAASLKFDKPQSVGLFVQELDELRRVGALSAKQFGDVWQQALSKLSVDSIDNLRLAMEVAKTQGIISAQQWAQANEQILGASFDRLGVNAAQALSSISEGAQEAIDSVELVARSAVAAGVGVENAARAIEMAFLAAIPKADSLEAIAALEKELKAMGAAGKISAEGIERTQAALDKQRATIEAQIPGIQSLEEALRQLGVKPQKELAALAASAKQAFDAVKASGTATPREINEAWKAMAEAAIAANDGVADASIKAQAQQYDMVVETDKAGKSIVKSMKEAEAATKDVGKAAKATAEQIAQLSEAGWDATKDLVAQARAHNAALAKVESSWIDATVAASKYSQEMAELVWSANKSIAAMTAEHARLVQMMEALADQQRQLEDQGNGAARGVDDLRLRLLELSGTEEEIARARNERDEQEVRRKMALMQIDLQRAQIGGKKEEAARLQAELALLAEQLKLLDQIFVAEQKQRKEREREGQRGGGGSGGQRGGGGGGVSTGQPVNITLNANGINDPVRLARVIQPELERLARLAR
jgi:tape measure domain-containing protein